MVTFLTVVLLLVLGVYLFFKQSVFGKNPSGGRLTRIRQSPHYRDGSFQNLHPTPPLAEGETMWNVLRKFLFAKKIRHRPSAPLPSQKTNLTKLDRDQNVLVWFGHSSYFMQIDGLTFLVDPVLSGSASPVGTTKSFAGSDVYTPADLPDIDYLIITHDHYDHLDHDTVVQLQPKVRNVLTGLGTGAHLEHWGYDAHKITENDWHASVRFEDGITVHWTPARHFSGRTFKRNQTLWTSFVLQTPTKKLYLGGDSGYDTHFAQIGAQHGPFDLAILECGQYNESWKYIHMLPEQVLTAAKELNAKILMTVHWGKFSLSVHAWDEPIKKVSEFALEENLPLLTPMIGEKIDLENIRTLENWWKTVD